MSVSIFARSALGLVFAATSFLAVAAPVSGQGTWQTTMKARDLDGNGSTDAYYDTALNITWLADANYAKTTNYAAADSLGRMNWSAAKTWADNLVVGAYSDWRLPTMVDTGTPGCNYAYSGTDCGYNESTSTSEMAHMYYVTLGNKALYSTSGVRVPIGSGLSNTGHFSNLQSYGYWSGLDYAPVAGFAWYFGTPSGEQGAGAKDVVLMAWAVRPGDVTAAAVPEPESWAFALAGLAVVGWAVRRRT